MSTWVTIAILSSLVAKGRLLTLVELLVFGAWLLDANIATTINVLMVILLLFSFSATISKLSKFFRLTVHAL